MQIIAILIGLVLLAAVAVYVTRPLLQQRRGERDATQLASLELQRDSLYAQIRELDMDHATGKTNEDDYQQLRAELMAQATTLLKQIDGVEAAPAPVRPVAPPAAVDDVEALIAARRRSPAASQAAPRTPPAAAVDDVEALIQARRKRPSPPAAAADDVEALIQARRKSAAPASVPALTCPTCGKPFNAGDAFCSKCGTALRTPTAG